MVISGAQTKCKISSTYCKVKQQPLGTVADNECDINTNSCCAGSNFIIMSCTRCTADIYPHDNLHEPMTNAPIVMTGTAWTDSDTKEICLLLFNECPYYGLINPN